jgi:hypothetical protein
MFRFGFEQSYFESLRTHGRDLSRDDFARFVQSVAPCRLRSPLLPSKRRQSVVVTRSLPGATSPEDETNWRKHETILAFLSSSFLSRDKLDRSAGKTEIFCHAGRGSLLTE